MFFERPKTRIRFERLAALTVGMAAFLSAAGVDARQTAKPPASTKPATKAKPPATEPSPDSESSPENSNPAEKTNPSEAPDPAKVIGYKIGPADILQVNVWKEPDLTREFEVRLDGMITLPLVGDLLASGRTPSQLAETLTKELGRFIEAPRVTVGVRANSARFYVVGQVTKSGEFPLTGRTTVVQGLALAGGFKEFANTAGIVIVRQDQTVIQVNYKRIADGKDVSTQNVFLAPGDTVVVP
jgi:polysaccharide export outer membrane protein